MTGKPSVAQRALVHTCTKLALVVIPNTTDELLVEELARILPSCYACTAPVLPLRTAAERLVSAQSARSRSAAEILMRQAVVQYHTMAAATLLDEFKKNGAGS